MKLIFGCGYLGRRVALRWLAAGHPVAALTRSREQAAELRGLGIEPLLGDLAAAEDLPPLPPAETVLWAVGWDGKPACDIHDVFVEGLRRVLSKLPPSVGRFLYVSSTGVYGPASSDPHARAAGQSTITSRLPTHEDSPRNPVRPGSQAHLEAEELLAAHPLGQRTVVLRLAGIYGPDRLPRAGDLLSGQAIPLPAAGPMNLIHVEDAAAAVLAAEDRAPLPRTYNVCDGHPVTRGEYLAELARRLGAPPPRFDSRQPEPPGSRRGSGGKRVSNQRLLAELAFKLAYPSYREGLAVSVGKQ